MKPAFSSPKSGVRGSTAPGLSKSGNGGVLGGFELSDKPRAKPAAHFAKIYRQTVALHFCATYTTTAQDGAYATPTHIPGVAPP